MTYKPAKKKHNNHFQYQKHKLSDKYIQYIYNKPYYLSFCY